MRVVVPMLLLAGCTRAHYASAPDAAAAVVDAPRVTAPPTDAGGSLPPIDAPPSFDGPIPPPHPLPTRGLDVDADGYDDLVVGALCAPQRPGSGCGPGRAYLYRGGPAGLGASPSVTLTGPDGPDGHFGAVVGSAGDTNADGYDDVVVGAPMASRAYVYFGGPDGLDPGRMTSLAQAETAPYSFGEAAVGVGDVDADGYGDLAVGAPSPGVVWLYFGAPWGFRSDVGRLGDPRSTFGGGFGIALARAGDVDGDGHADVVIGCDPSSAGVGRAYVHRGGPAGLAAEAWATYSSPTGDAFGNPVLGGIDVEGDGALDVLVGAPSSLGADGRAYLFSAVRAGEHPPDLAFDSASAEWLYGRALSIRDVDEDGWNDVLVGHPGASTVSVGRVEIFRGGPGGLDAVPDHTLVGPVPTPRHEGGFFGIAIASPADYDADGHLDLAIGADGSMGSRGRVYVYRGRAGGLPFEWSEIVVCPDDTGANAFGRSLS